VSTARKSRKKSSKKKSDSKKSAAKKRVKQQKPSGFQRVVNFILATALVLMIAFGAYYLLSNWSLWHTRALADNRTCVTAWYLDNSVYYLVPINRMVSLQRDEVKTIRAVEELVKGPDDPDLARVYPADMPPPNVWIEAETVHVDIPGLVWDTLAEAGREVTLVDAVGLTVRDAGEYETIRYLVDSGRIESISDGRNLSRAVGPPEFVNKVPDDVLTEGAHWLSVWYLDSTGSYLLPFSFETTSDSFDGMEAVRLAMGLPPEVMHVANHVAPEGYSLVDEQSVRIENGTARVFLQGLPIQSGFQNKTRVNIFRRALYLTLKDCCDVEDVVLVYNDRELETYTGYSDLIPVADGKYWSREPEMSADEQTSPEEEEAE